MIQKKLDVLNPKGIHTRPSALLIQATQKYNSVITIENNGTTVEANSVLNILMLNASFGSELIVTIEGDDEEVAMDAIINIFNMKFDEAWKQFYHIQT